MSRSSLARTAVTIAMLLLVACEASSAQREPASTRARSTSTATDFSARDVEGNTVRLSTYLERQVILLNFFATWCEPCVAEFPHLRKLVAANRASGLIVLGIAMDGPESVASVGPFARRNQLNFPVLLDEDSQVAATYNPKKSAPLSVLIDRRGRIVSIREGYNPGDEVDLTQEIAKMLEPSSGPQ